jgi:rRNA maturation RNase YbeY
MIAFNFETNFEFLQQEKIATWILSCIEEEGFSLGEVNYIFCDDAYLHQLNVEFLKHDTFTDIISFDTTLGKEVGGDIFISIARVKENSKTFKVAFEEELHRVMIHGVLHYLGYKDKTADEQAQMTAKENECLKKLIN